jgi:transposase InsO family protein
MSRIACPWDNAQAESFMKTLKHEEVDARNYRMIDDAKSAIGTFIDNVYNTQRLHSALNYQAPVVFETTRATQLAAVQQPAGWLTTDCV